MKLQRFYFLQLLVFIGLGKNTQKSWYNLQQMVWNARAIQINTIFKVQAPLLIVMKVTPSCVPYTSWINSHTQGAKYMYSNCGPGTFRWFFKPKWLAF